MIIGLLLSVLLFAAFLGCFFPSRRARLFVFVLGAGLAFAPVPTIGGPFGNWLYSVFDAPAVTTVALALYYGIWRKRPREEKESDASDKDASSKSLPLTQLRVCGALILLASVVLWLSETNVIAFDFYRLGFLRTTMASVVCLAIILLDVRLSLLAIAAYLATEFGLYANFLDAIFDPFLTACLLIYFVSLAFKAFRENARKRSLI